MTVDHMSWNAFYRYGRVQSVKFLSKKGSGGGGGSSNADSGSSSSHHEGVTVAFMDIQSANKALNVEHKFEDRVLRTNYYDPSASYNSTGDRGSSIVGPSAASSSSVNTGSTASTSISRLHPDPEGSSGPNNGDSRPSSHFNQRGPNSGQDSGSSASYSTNSGGRVSDRRFPAGNANSDDHGSRQQRTVRPVGSYRSQAYTNDG